MTPEDEVRAFLAECRRLPTESVVELLDGRIPDRAAKVARMLVDMSSDARALLDAALVRADLKPQ